MKKLIPLTMILLFISCSGLKRTVEVNNSMRMIELNEETIEFVREYRKKYKKETVVYLSYKKEVISNKNVFYINRISSLSMVYKFYISYYSIIDGIPVVISSKKDGFINPDSYTANFVKLMGKYLLDDMLMNSITVFNNQEDHWLPERHINNIIIDHSEVWRVKNEELTKKWKKHPVEEKVMIENEDIDLMDYYRVIEGGIDVREKKHVPIN